MRTRPNKLADGYNWQLKNQTNAIGAIHDNEFFSVGLFDCSINSDIFHGRVEELLIPELPGNNVIFMDMSEGFSGD